MFEITMLPARVGDALWIEYGDRGHPNRILVDCGTPGTWKGGLRQRLDALGSVRDDRFELLIVTHVDSDHIGSVLPLIASPHASRFDRIWFNAWRHLAPESLDILGPQQGEVLTQQILAMPMRWNVGFLTADKAARRPNSGRLRTRTLPGGMRLTVVAPGRAELDILKPVWKRAVEEAGLVPGVKTQALIDLAADKGVALDLLGDPVPEWAAYDPTDLDRTEANGSSIAVLAEYEEDGQTRSCLLTGDAHGPVLVAGIARLARQRGEDRLRVDVVKAPHHGSLRNLTTELVKVVDARTWLFSSDGVQHGHPHRQAVARVLVHGSKPASLKFNYRTEFNDIWDVLARKRKYRYDTEYGDGELTVRI